MKNNTLITKLFLAITIIFAVVMKAGAETELSSSFSSWDTSNCTVSATTLPTTITYSEAWAGAGCWLKDIYDLSDETYIWLTVKGCTADVKLCIQYYNSETTKSENSVNIKSEATASAGNVVIIGAPIDTELAKTKPVSQFFLQSMTAPGFITVMGAYAGTEEEFNAAQTTAAQTPVYAANFVIDGTTTTKFYYEGETIEAPTRSGYTISGWKDTNGNTVTLTTMSANDVTYTAVFTKDEESGSTTTYKDPVAIEYDDYGQVLSSAFNGYSDDAKIEFTFDISGSSSYSGWGVGAIKSLDGSVTFKNISADGTDGKKTISFTLGDIKDLLNAGPDQYSRYGIIFDLWSTGNNNECTATRKSLTISEVSDFSGTGYQAPGTTATKYNANFIINGATSTKAYSKDETIEFPTAVKTGYTFDKWIDKDGNAVTLPVTMQETDVTFTAQFTGSYTEAWSTELKVEAEDATYASYSGCGLTQQPVTDGTAIRMTDTSDQLFFRFNRVGGGKYKVIARTEGVDGDKKVVCAVNGASTSFIAANNDVKEVEIGTFNFADGNNTITFSSSWCWVDIDYVRLEADDSNVSFNVSSTLVTNGSTEAAYKAYAFLRHNFGSKTLSGVMTGNMQDIDGNDIDGTDITEQADVKAVYNKSGRYPTIVGFDFMNGTGKEASDSWYTTYTSKAISLAKDVWNRGGIPTFAWHWRDPSKNTNEFKYDDTTYNDEKFDFSDALNDDGTWSSSDNATNMRSDIKKVADYFKALAADGVACIFRPLHEGPTGGFWWGAQGAAKYKQLYERIYDEMVNVNGVKNLIWDFNCAPAYSTDWCPASQYYDIMSTDVYNSDGDYQSNYVAFNKMAEITEGEKLLSLSECGPIPDTETQVSDNAMWSFWMAWYNSMSTTIKYIDQTSNDEWTSVMSNEHIITNGTTGSRATWDTMLTDDAPTLTKDKAYTAGTLSYIRTLSEGYATFCLPFDVNLSSMSNFENAYTFNKVTKNASTNLLSISLKAIDKSKDIPAGTPFITECNAGDVVFTNAKDVTFTGSETPIENTTNLSDVTVTMTGTFTKLTGLDRDLYRAFLTDGNFGYATWVKPFRAYIIKGGTNAAKFTFAASYDEEEENTSGIDDVENINIDVNAPAYNLAGQRVNIDTKGIVIINGKKTFNK